MSLNVEDVGNNPLADGQYIRLYHYNGGGTPIYTGIRVQVSSCVVIFSAVPDGDYVLYWESKDVYSSQFTAADGTTITFSVVN